MLTEDAPSNQAMIEQLKLIQARKPDTDLCGDRVSKTLGTDYKAPKPVGSTRVGVSPRPGTGFDLSRFTGEDRQSEYGSLLVDAPPQRPQKKHLMEKYEKDLERWDGALPKARERDLGKDKLGGVHGLYIPGNPIANPTQTDTKQNHPKDGGEKRERDTRNAYELELIQEARLRGMPTMAICGGSWTLLQGYGGEVSTLPSKSHLGGLDQGKHGLQMQPNTLLSGTTPVLAKKDDREHSDKVDLVNSTHWATPHTDEDGFVKREGSGEDPNDLLEVSARSPKDQVVEGFESKFGAPMLGVQWHPEAYLVDSKARSSATGEAKAQSELLFQTFEDSTKTYARRQQVNDEIRARVPKVDPG